MHIPIVSIFFNKGEDVKNNSSLQDLTWAPMESALVVARIFLDSSDRLTPPIVATSLISSSPSLKENQELNKNQFHTQDNST